MEMEMFIFKTMEIETTIYFVLDLESFLFQDDIESAIYK